jgi:DNA polymerase III delta subunit
MIYIVHGEDLSYSRNIILNQQKKLGMPARIEVSVSDVSPQQLQENITTFDIFGTPPFIVLDVSGSGRMKLDDYVKILEKTPDKTTLIILSSKELSKTNAFIKNASKLGAKVVLAQKKPSSNVFRFVDYIYNGSRRQAYQEYKKLMEDGEDSFYLLSMILYGLRNISYAKYNSPEFGKIAPFAKSKAIEQSKHYEEKEIVKLYKDLYKLDKELKTGIILPEAAIPLIMEKIFYARKI